MNGGGEGGGGFCFHCWPAVGCARALGLNLLPLFQIYLVYLFLWDSTFLFDRLVFLCTGAGSDRSTVASESPLLSCLRSASTTCFAAFAALCLLARVFFGGKLFCAGRAPSKTSLMNFPASSCGLSGMGMEELSCRALLDVRRESDGMVWCLGSGARRDLAKGDGREIFLHNDPAGFL